MHVLDIKNLRGVKNVSNLKDLDKILGIKPKYDYKVQDYVGSMQILGLELPENPVFNPLDKIWSSVRKRIYDCYGVATTAIFVVTPEAISCSFYLNCAGIKENAQEHKKHNRKFKETFDYQMMLFEEAITTFLSDMENGYIAYCAYLESCKEKGEKISAKTCEKMFDTFLTSAGYKTAEDERKKRKIQKAAAKAVRH